MILPIARGKGGFSKITGTSTWVSPLKTFTSGPAMVTSRGRIAASHLTPVFLNPVLSSCPGRWVTAVPSAYDASSPRLIPSSSRCLPLVESSLSSVQVVASAPTLAVNPDVEYALKHMRSNGRGDLWQQVWTVLTGALLSSLPLGGYLR